MKIRQFKHRARRPDFRMMQIGKTKYIEMKSYSAVDRFFSTDAEETKRAEEFFSIST